MRKRRKYEKKIEVRLLENSSKTFLLEHLRKEWQEIERSKRRKEILDMTKKGAKAVGLAILTLAALGGVVLIATVAPNIFSAVGRSVSQRRYFNRREVIGHLAALKQRGYIERNKKRGTGADVIEEVRLTELGMKKVLQHALGELKIRSLEKWDGIWRMVIFDIPDRHKHARDGLRSRLKIMGFYQLQESVFVFPYPCREEVEFCTSIYSISDYVRFIETKSLLHDFDLKEYFSLA